MTKKYNSLEEASKAVVKYKEDMAHFEKEILFLEKRLQSKKEMFGFVRHQFLMAEDAVIDFELSQGWPNDEDENMGYDKS